MEVIHIKPSKTLAKRIGNWSTEADFSQVAEELEVVDSIAEAFRDRNLDSTPPQLDVVIRPESKWQDVNSHHHSANLVLLLLLPFLIPQTHFMLHLSIVPFYPLYRVVNPHFPFCPTTYKPRWCTCFVLLAPSSSPCCFNVY
jgi:hypothetical protein